MSSIADIRKDYKLKRFNETDADVNPFAQFTVWWQEALAAAIEEVNAMTLATASLDGIPAARIVLLKDYNEQGFVFFTNYESYKAQQLAENPRATLLFFWKELERQVRLTGMVEKVSDDESDAYFFSRPVGSRIGAWASPQSQPIANRQWLEDKVNTIKQQYANGNIPRPQHWGGYRVKPVIFEFWQGRENRLHDRIQYSLNENGGWVMERLAP